MSAPGIEFEYLVDGLDAGMDMRNYPCQWSNIRFFEFPGMEIYIHQKALIPISRAQSPVPDDVGLMIAFKISMFKSFSTIIHEKLMISGVFLDPVFLALDIDEYPVKSLPVDMPPVRSP